MISRVSSRCFWAKENWCANRESKNYNLLNKLLKGGFKEVKSKRHFKLRLLRTLCWNKSKWWSIHRYSADWLANLERGSMNEDRFGRDVERCGEWRHSSEGPVLYPGFTMKSRSLPLFASGWTWMLRSFQLPRSSPLRRLVRKWSHKLPRGPKSAL